MLRSSPSASSRVASGGNGEGHAASASAAAWMLSTLLRSPRRWKGRHSASPKAHIARRARAQPTEPMLCRAPDGRGLQGGGAGSTAAALGYGQVAHGQDG